MIINDIIFIGNATPEWESLKARFPTAKRADNFEAARKKSFTKMFWAVWNDVNICKDFDFSYVADEWNKEYIHVFKNGEYRDGIILCPKRASVTQEEIDTRMFDNKKEHDVVASTPKKYDIFYVKNHEDYLSALENTTTEMFWVVWNDVEISDTFDFNLYYPHYNPVDRKQNHVFMNGEYQDGILLCSIHIPLSNREIEYHFPVNKKQHDIVASTPKKYDVFHVANFEDYLFALENTTTEMFWAVWNDVEVCDDFDFDWYYPHYNPVDRKQNHVFMNGEYRDGICLFSKNTPVTKKEIDHRFFVDKKEHNVVASTPKKYDIFYVNDYSDYENALKNTTTEMFWAVWDDVEICDDFDFDWYYPHYNPVDRKQNHVFMNGEYRDGICLFSKNTPVTKKEIDHRFFVDKKEHNVVASTPKKYDIFYVNDYSDYENALKNTTTEMFWAVWNDVEVRDDFDFNWYYPHYNPVDRKQNHVFLNGEYRDGICLFSKNTPVSKKEIEHRFLVNKKEHDVVASTPKKYDVFYVSNFDDYLSALRNTTTEMFWAVWDDVEICNDFDFSYHVPLYDTISLNTTHIFLNGEYRDGICLFSKNTPVTKREVEHRFFVDKKEVDIIASIPKKYDVFHMSNFEDYEHAVASTTTEMFWAVWNDVEVNDDFNFSYHVPLYDTISLNTTHVFLNGKHRDGICLFSKNTPVNKKEIEHRFFVDKKEVDIIASTPKKYDVFHISNFDEYERAVDDATTEMFWAVWNDVEVCDDFDFKDHVTVNETIRFYTTHVYLNGKYRDGICLFSKTTPVSRNEVEHRFFVNKKEVDIVASLPKKYDIFYINGNEDYRYALENATTEMFWAVWDDVEISEDFNFNYHVPLYDTVGLNATHVFLNGEYRDGICLFSKTNRVSKKEIEHRFFVDKKEVDIIASTPKKYDVFYISNFNDYKHALENTTTEMFWAVWKDVEVCDDFNFDWYYPHYRAQDRKQNHVFKNNEYYDGVLLCSIHTPLGKREIDYGFIVNRQEHDVLASMPKPFDVVFISYNEANAEENYQNLLEVVPDAKRVHGVKGIHQAHIEAAKLSTTEMFWVVDGDARLVASFNFDYQVPRWDYDCVHVWRSRNPVNDLTYGYGGVKLLPTEMTKQVDVESADMTTSISNKFKAVEEISNVTEFNTDAFSTWRSAFRECVKLASNVIRGQIDEETKARLDTWCRSTDSSKFGEYARLGAISGREYGLSTESSVQLGKINDYDWLYQQFLKETNASS